MQMLFWPDKKFILLKCAHTFFLMRIFLIYAHLGISIQDFFMQYSKKWMETQLVSFYKSYNDSLVITYSS